ncbi:DUF1266 domain-containing protein [Leucobacter sp. CSA2]|uniref:DUF1266 domain-containing protein n=1 Tax=Leucobacter edaphi TaxID=2796472 RepID=A0A934UWJ6_9MICO|nr:DUF1266 domain-containing protein [Leucobacter edaphi]MBK0420606.1 DUF1266 domain-containing protein [Leucobacter edaphi]
MAPELVPIVLAVFGVVILLCVLMIVGAVKIRKKRAGVAAAAPGAPTVQIPSDPRLRFGPALAAMYARSEWHRTRGAKRTLTAEQCYFGYGCVLPQNDLRAALARDWGVRDAASARQQIAAGLQAIEAQTGSGGEGGRALSADSAAELAFDLGRVANLVRWSGSAGYLQLAEAQDASADLGARAATAFGSWESFGEQYVNGLRAHSRSGNRTFEQATAWLLSDAESPWRQLPWPAAA